MKYFSSTMSVLAMVASLNHITVGCTRRSGLGFYFDLGYAELAPETCLKTWATWLFSQQPSPQSSHFLQDLDPCSFKRTLYVFYH